MDKFCEGHDHLKAWIDKNYRYRTANRMFKTCLQPEAYDDILNERESIAITRPLRERMCDKIKKDLFDFLSPRDFPEQRFSAYMFRVALDMRLEASVEGGVTLATPHTQGPKQIRKTRDDTRVASRVQNGGIGEPTPSLRITRENGFKKRAIAEASLAVSGDLTVEQLADFAIASTDCNVPAAQLDGDGDFRIDETRPLKKQKRKRSDIATSTVVMRGTDEQTEAVVKLGVEDHDTMPAVSPYMDGYCLEAEYVRGLARVRPAGTDIMSWSYALIDVANSAEHQLQLLNEGNVWRFDEPYGRDESHDHYLSLQFARKMLSGELAQIQPSQVLAEFIAAMQPDLQPQSLRFVDKVRDKYSGDSAFTTPAVLDISSSWLAGDADVLTHCTFGQRTFEA
ncbi:hypothetical protein CKM354_000936300 [Cercospora kikuchii]|uniref:Uncharacterized protein n=1 Tax=Cercospora kikuchii TaxID=84275 RepID=A0A9P3FKA1_9PEZI|nr:uncharacterized protein CKM354_000936300 [Cercospora kikuchii]GIZ46230.1 hypothetical protein CKM354_000936300 [Cercospora kikuchii]